MKRLSVNPKIAVLTFAVMFFSYGITSLGYATESEGGSPHFHLGSTSRSIAPNAAIGTNVGAPVTAHNFDADAGHQYSAEGIDSGTFNINSLTGQLTTRTALFPNESSYQITVSVVSVPAFPNKGHATVQDSINVTIEVEGAVVHTVTTKGGDDQRSPPDLGEAEGLPSVSSEERARIAGALAMDRVIFNELRNAATDTQDWVELRNVSEADIALDGWEVRIVGSETTSSVTLPAGTVLPAGGLLLLVNTDPDAPEMPLSLPEENVVSLVDAGLILPQTNFTLLLRSATSWEDSVGNFFFGFEIPPTAPPLTMDAAWYRARPDALGYQSEAWVMSGYQDGIGYDTGIPETGALGTPGHPQSSLIGDVNGDGIVNILDLVFVASHFGEAEATQADLNGDGAVNIQDLVLVANRLGSVAAAPSAQGLHTSHVQQWLALAKQEVASRSIQTSVSEQQFSYARGIQVLEQLLATLVPKSTALLANYPNPFNPETWIPYRLATGSDVQLHIYDTLGRLVRHLNIGHQAAGVYQTRSRAAYWDGTNEMGENVASGLYFYTLTAGDFSATRRMLILK